MAIRSGQVACEKVTSLKQSKAVELLNTLVPEGKDEFTVNNWKNASKTNRQTKLTEEELLLMNELFISQLEN